MAALVGKDPVSHPDGAGHDGVQRPERNGEGAVGGNAGVHGGHSSIDADAGQHHGGGKVAERLQSVGLEGLPGNGGANLKSAELDNLVEALRQQQPGSPNRNNPRHHPK